MSVLSVIATPISTFLVWTLALGLSPVLLFERIIFIFMLHNMIFISFLMSSLKERISLAKAIRGQIENKLAKAMHATRGRGLAKFGRKKRQ